MASIISAGTTSNTALNMTADTTGVLQLATGATPTTAVTIDASQNVGIGTASPAYKLDVNGTGRLSNGVVIPNNNWLNCTNTSGTVRDSFGYFTDNNLYITAWDGAMILRSGGNTERMRIDSSGSAYINGTTKRGGAYLNLAANASGSDTCLSLYQATAVNVTQVAIYTPSGLAGYINTSGTTTAYGSVSDYRLKENVVSMTGALDKVMQLNPVTYTWKIDGSKGQGFIAHELKEIVPDAVQGEKDAVDEEGNIKPQGIDTSFLVATLTAAIQEQTQIINDLKLRITALESK